MEYTYKYPRPAVTADCVVIATLFPSCVPRVILIGVVDIRTVTALLLNVIVILMIVLKSSIIGQN